MECDAVSVQHRGAVPFSRLATAGWAPSELGRVCLAAGGNQERVRAVSCVPEGCARLPFEHRCNAACPATDPELRREIQKGIIWSVFESLADEVSELQEPLIS